MKRFARFCALLMVLVMALSLGISAYADGKVTYEGDANKFIFAPGSKESPTNLFENFQNVFPGDTLTEQITIKNATSNRTQIKVYLRSLGAQENTDDFLSQMKMTVKYKGDSPLFEAPVDETAQLTDWVYLGAVHSGGEVTLDVTLEVPLTMGDEYQNQVGYVDWEFKVVEIPREPGDPDQPQTGDTSNIYLYSALLIFFLAALIFLVLAAFRKKKKQSDEA